MKKIQNFIAKLLGLPTSLEIAALRQSMETLNSSFEHNTNTLQRVNKEFNEFKSDIRLLYKEVSSDIKRVDGKVSRVKPILKVDDPEAITFIKGILSRHDTQIGTQSTAIQTKVLELNKLQRESEAAVKQAQESSTKLNNVLNGLGLDDLTKPEPFQKLRDVIQGKVAL
jgi:chromosome segregation ATPase